MESANKALFVSQLSNDPGRYLCNYIYFRSVFDISEKVEGNHSLFVHFPPYSELLHAKNVAFVMHLIGELLKPKEKENNLTVEVKEKENEIAINSNGKEENNALASN